MNPRLKLLLEELLDLPAGQVTADMRRESTATWDSMNHLRLMTAIESELGIQFTMTEITSIQTPQEIDDLLEQRGVGEN